MPVNFFCHKINVTYISQIQVVVETSTSDDNVVDDDNQTQNVQDGLPNSPETMKDNKNIQNNTEKSSVSIVGKKRRLPDEVGMAPKKTCVGSVKNVENDHTYYVY